MNELIPFGKYKGQPIDAMQNDKQYLDWLTAQDWFRNKYQNIYSIIINNFTEPSETPEHNKFQGLFLDDEFVKKYLVNNKKIDKFIDSEIIFEEIFYYDIKPVDRDFFRSEDCRFAKSIKCGYKIKEIKNIEYKIKRRFENNGSDVEIEIWCTLIISKVIISCIEYFKEDYLYNFSKCNNIINKPRDIGNIYSINDFTKYIDYCDHRIEIKPVIGDDYPAILRQMKNSKSYTLFYKEYTGTGLSEENMIKIFNNENIYVVKIDEEI